MCILEQRASSHTAPPPLGCLPAFCSPCDLAVEDCLLYGGRYGSGVVEAAFKDVCGKLQGGAGRVWADEGNGGDKGACKPQAQGEVPVRPAQA